MRHIAPGTVGNADLCALLQYFGRHQLGKQVQCCQCVPRQCRLSTASARVALLGPLDFLCLDSHHATSLARVSALEELHACCVLQLSYIPDAFLVDTSLLLSLLADPLNYLRSPNYWLHVLQQV